MKTHKFTFLLLTPGFLLLASCASTRQSDDVRNSGFLSDYERLKEDEVGGSSWANASFGLEDYQVCYVPPVELRLTPENARKLESEDANRLARLFRTTAVDKLAKNGWTIVEQPGEHTITIRMALTELDGASPYGNVLTGLPTMLNATTQLLAIAGDVHVFVGEVSTEVQITDSSTGTILAEALDRRVGAQSMLNMGSTWGDVRDAMDIWTDRIAKGLSKQQEQVAR